MATWVETLWQPLRTFWTTPVPPRREPSSDIEANYYRGASKDRLQDGRWGSTRLAQRDALEEDLQDLRDRSRELCRDDSIGGAIDERCEHDVGVGFVLRAMARDTGAGAEAEQNFRRQMEQLFGDWSPYAGIDGRTTWWQVLRLVDRNLATDGEALIVWQTVSDPESPLPFALEVIDIDRLETPHHEAANPRIRLGIETDERKRIIAYHIRTSHPNDLREMTVEWDRVEAERVCHVFEPLFAEQPRGLPWMVRTLGRQRNLSDLQEAGLIAAQVESCFTAWIKSQGDPRAKAKAAATETRNGQLLQDLEPGTVKRLGPDEEIQFGSPTRGNTVGTLQEFELRQIAAAMNWPVEMLGRQWQGTSFAGGRLVLQSLKLSTRARQKLLRERFCEPVYRRLCDWAVLTGQVTVAPQMYLARKKRWQTHAWTPPAWGYAINPGEETTAAGERIAMGLSTYASEIAELGGDLEEQWAQQAEEQRLRETLGLPPLAAGQGLPLTQPLPTNQPQTTGELNG
jgi:lambda family phage portal protein